MFIKLLLLALPLLGCIQLKDTSHDGIPPGNFDYSRQNHQPINQCIYSNNPNDPPVCKNTDEDAFYKEAKRREAIAEANSQPYH